MRATMVFLALLAFALPSVAQDERFAGDWQGTLTVGVAELPLILHLRQGDDGDWTGTMDSPAQGATGLPAGRIDIDGQSINIYFTSLRARYEAILEGLNLVGTWHQSGRSFPLEMVAVTEEE